MTEQRRFYSVFALLLVYGLSEYLRSRQFILPLPFFELLLLIYTLLSAKDAYLDRKVKPLLQVGGAVFLFFSRTYNYSFFRTDEQIDLLSQTVLFDVSYLLFALCLLMLSISTLERKTPTLILVTLSILTMVLGFATNTSYLLALSFGFQVIEKMRKQELFAHANSFWALLLLLELARSLQLDFF